MQWEKFVENVGVEAVIGCMTVKASTAAADGLLKRDLRLPINHRQQAIEPNGIRLHWHVVGDGQTFTTEPTRRQFRFSAPIQ